MKRLFIAVPLPSVAQQAVAALVDQVRTRGEDEGVRWVRMDCLHLTLRFLGPTEEDRVAPLAGAVELAAAAVHPFAVRIAGAGAFPSLHRPRALWLGVVQGAEEMSAAARALDEPLATLGWPPEARPFRAHLTLARTDGARGGAATARSLLAAADSGFAAGFDADRIILFESVTGHGPARYEPLVEVGIAR